MDVSVAMVMLLIRVEAEQRFLWQWIIVGLGVCLCGMAISENGDPNQEGAENDEGEKQSKEFLKNRLIADAVHELRNMVALVLGPISLIDDSLDEVPESVRSNLSIAKKNVKRLSETIDQLVDLSRLDVDQLHLKKEAYDLRKQLAQLIDSYQPLAQKQGVTFTRLLPDRSVIINADRSRMAKVFTNLISNAIKFSPDGGYVDISLSIEDKGAIIQVKDTGVGIAEKDQSHLFDRYFTRGSGKVENREGLGIGLSMSYEYIEKHGGRLEVESQEGHGTAFRVWLPLIEDDTLRSYTIEHASSLQQRSVPTKTRFTGRQQLPDLTQEDSANARDLSSRQQVLIVEDNKDLRLYIREVVTQECQVSVRDVASAEQAWEVVSNEPIDLIITDLYLPGEDGFEMIKRIQERYSLLRLPILILSGSDLKRDRIRGFRIGVNDFMSKPFDAKELAVRVQNLLQYKSERDFWNNKTYGRDQDAQGNDGSSVQSLLKPLQKEEKAYLKKEIELQEKLVEYILDELQNSTLTVEDLAHQVALSKRQLYRKCKQLFGLTPGQLIRELRLKQAQIMLEEPSVETVSELVYAVGFNNSGYFSKLYEERFGRRPSDYL